MSKAEKIKTWSYDGECKSALLKLMKACDYAGTHANKFALGRIRKFAVDMYAICRDLENENSQIANDNHHEKMELLNKIKIQREAIIRLGGNPAFDDIDLAADIYVKRGNK